MDAKMAPCVLIADDDLNLCKTLTVALQTAGYSVKSVTSGKQALEAVEEQFFDVALVDIKLPDISGIQLLTGIAEVSPKTMLIVITGFPEIRDAIEAMSIGASAYIVKPFDPAQLLGTIRKKLAAQQQTQKTNMNKSVDLEVDQHKLSNLHEVLEETSEEFACLGLTKTQAKIYIAIVALGAPSASEISVVSGVRREEVYRFLPKLGKQGLITMVLGAPRRYSAMKPEIALTILARNRFRAIKEEIDMLHEKKREIVLKLETTLGSKERTISSVEAFPKEAVFEKLIDMGYGARREILGILQLENLKHAYFNVPEDLRQKIMKARNGCKTIRILTERQESTAFLEEVIHVAETRTGIDIRFADSLPFNIIIVDNKEAVWGGLSRKEQAQSLWTNDPMQIAILKAAFESLWMDALGCSRALRNTGRKDKS